MGVSNPGSPWGPMLARSVVALVFGALTVFWQDPTEPVLTVAGGLYLLLTGAVLLPQASTARSVAGVRPLLLVEAVLYVLAGAATLILSSAEAFRTAGSAALIAGGVLELFLWIRSRNAFVPARDWLITGAAALVAGILLPVVFHLGVRALLGVSGGSAIIIGVILAISGLGLRHDSRSVRGESAKAVN